MKNSVSGKSTKVNLESSIINYKEYGEDLPIHVLYVDDDSNFLEVSKLILEQQGSFEVESVLSVGDAYVKMGEKEFDVVVSDFQMPKKDGIQFLKELRDDSNNIPFILFTGRGREEIAIKALNLGADRYFNKFGKPETVYGQLAHGIFQVVEKQKSEKRFRESEEKYRFLFENMIEGFSYCKIILNKKNKPIDFVYLEVNDAFEKLTGLKRETIVGKRVSDVIPGTLENYSELFEFYGRVALTGKPEEFEIFVNPLNLWLSVSVCSLKKGFFAAMFENITERKRKEVAHAFTLSHGLK